MLVDENEHRQESQMKKKQEKATNHERPRENFEHLGGEFIASVLLQRGAAFDLLRFKHAAKARLRHHRFVRGII